MRAQGPSLMSFQAGWTVMNHAARLGGGRGVNHTAAASSGCDDIIPCIFLRTFGSVSLHGAKTPKEQRHNGSVLQDYIWNVPLTWYEREVAL